MKKTLVSLAVGTVIALTVTTSAIASPLFLNNGIDWAFDADASTKTGNFANLGFTGTTATSIYLGNPAVVGTQVVDTNVQSVMNSYGFTAASQTTLSGGTFVSKYPIAPQGMNMAALNPSTDTNGFSSANPFAYGFGGTWGLSYDYTFFGQTTSTDVNFTSGYFNMFYEDGTTRTQVLRMNITGSQFSGVSLLLKGKASFDFDGNDSDDSTAFSQAFWNDADTGKTLYQSWLLDPSAVDFSISTAVTPALPTAQQLWVGTDLDPVTAGVQGVLFRQTQLDGNLSFNVPEPGSLALVGLGLIGLAAARRRKSV